jgi:DNA polymerase-3 subunit epsilon
MYLCVLDTETTGLNPQVHEIIEIAAIITNTALKPLDALTFRIQPKYPERIEKKAAEVNGYSQDTWDPQFFTHSAALTHLNKMVSRFCKNDVVVLSGQNIRFDIGFLKETYKRERVPYLFSPTEYVDLMDLAKLWEKVSGNALKSKHLKDLIQVAGVVNDRPHSAYFDTEATLKTIQWFVNDLRERKVNV